MTTTKLINGHYLFNNIVLDCILVSECAWRPEYRYWLTSDMYHQENYGKLAKQNYLKERISGLTMPEGTLEAKNE